MRQENNQTEQSIGDRIRAMRSEPKPGEGTAWQDTAARFFDRWLTQVFQSLPDALATYTESRFANAGPSFQIGKDGALSAMVGTGYALFGRGEAQLADLKGLDVTETASFKKLDDLARALDVSFHLSARKEQGMDTIVVTVDPNYVYEPFRPKPTWLNALG